MRKTQLGLLQSLLYQVLAEKPALQNVLFPLEVQEGALVRWREQSFSSETIWTLPGLKAVFDNLLCQSSFKICLLVDGLDEYDGDHSEITELFGGIKNRLESNSAFQVGHG